jgi:hypothetical protein
MAPTIFKAWWASRRIAAQVFAQKFRGRFSRPPVVLAREPAYFFFLAAFFVAFFAAFFVAIVFYSPFLCSCNGEQLQFVSCIELFNFQVKRKMA